MEIISNFEFKEFSLKLLGDLSEDEPLLSLYLVCSKDVYLPEDYDDIDNFIKCTSNVIETLASNEFRGHEKDIKLEDIYASIYFNESFSPLVNKVHDDIINNEDFNYKYSRGDAILQLDIEEDSLKDFLNNIVKDEVKEDEVKEDEEKVQEEKLEVKPMEEVKTPTKEITEESPSNTDKNGNVNCVNCIDCYDCINCHDCTGCVNCINCDNCKDSMDLLNCSNCSTCHTCKNCKNSEMIMNSIACSNIKMGSQLKNKKGNVDTVQELV